MLHVVRLCLPQERWAPSLKACELHPKFALHPIHAMSCTSSYDDVTYGDLYRYAHQLELYDDAIGEQGCSQLQYFRQLVEWDMDSGSPLPWLVAA